MACQYVRHCKKYNLFQRLLFKIGFSPEKVLKKGKTIGMDQDPIQMLIDLYEENNH